MSAKVPAFSTIGQEAKEVLTGARQGIYQYNKKLTFSARSKDGVDVTSTVVQSGSNATEATFKAAYKTGDVALSGTAFQTGKVLGQVGYTGLTPGLSLTLSGTYPELQSGKLNVDYNLPHVTIKGSVGLTSSPVLDAAITAGDPRLFAGVDTSFNTSTQTLTKWTFGAGWLRSDIQVGAQLLDKAEVVKLTYAQKFYEDYVGAAELTHNIKKGQSTSIVLGAQRRLENGALVKARIDSDNIVSLHWEGSVHPNTTVGLSAQLNARDLEAPPKFGFAASAVA